MDADEEDAALRGMAASILKQDMTPELKRFCRLVMGLAETNYQRHLDNVALVNSWAKK